MYEAVRATVDSAMARILAPFSYLLHMSATSLSRVEVSVRERFLSPVTDPPFSRCTYAVYGLTRANAAELNEKRR
jgi:hypothetical protein